MSGASRTEVNGLGITMCVAFLILMIGKLAGRFDASWWWVASPLWIPLATAFALFVVGVAIIGGVWCVVNAYGAIAWRLRRRKQRSRA